MTLILGLANRQQAVLISDRRLSGNGKVIEEESNKAAILNCQNARLAVAYTGLAKAGIFQTRQWLLEALLKSAEPDHLMGPTISRFRDLATRDFSKISLTRKSDKRLSVVLLGYSYDELSPRCYYFLVSNFERFGERDAILAEPANEFRLTWGRESRPSEVSPSVVIVAGAGRGVNEKHIQSLRTLLLENRPAEALVGKGVEILREVADSKLSDNLIGEQCTSVVLPSRSDAEAFVQYHSAKIARKSYGISIIEARGGQFGPFIIDSPEVWMKDSSGQPVTLEVPRVSRNRPCPCGSGKRYKKCCGRPQRKKTLLKFGANK